MHGGFSEDHDTGIIYTGIPGYGLCSISKDLKKWTVLNDEDLMKENIHGITVFEHGGEKLLGMALNDAELVAILNLEGEILQVL